MPVKFIFLILPQVHIMDLAGPDQVILESIGFGAHFEMEYCSIPGDLISSAGLHLGKVKDYTQVKLKPGDFLIVPGSNVDYLLSPAFKKNKALLLWIQSAFTQGVNICSICAGAFVLAQTGILNGIPCTTHFKRTAQLQQLYPELKVVENVLFVEHEGIYTSAGIASGIDMALHIVEQLKGSYFAHQVARELVVYSRRNGQQPQQSDLMAHRNHIHAGIHKVQDWLIKNIEQKNGITDLAEIACMSERNFTRIFKKETSITVNNYINLVRKEKVKELMKNPDLSRLQMAKKIGLTSERQLSRLLKEM
jgi:transcriptional regulator GlxA family with amidase domain